MNKIKYYILIIFFILPNTGWSKNQVDKQIIYSQIIYPEVTDNIVNPLKLGEHNLKAFGLNIYFIELFSDKINFSYQNNLALVINYKRSFQKKFLVKRSIEEISELNNIDDTTLLSYYEEILNEIFFDVEKGDRKTAYFNPKKGLKLYLNGKLIGKIEDIIFAQRFMDIWLNPNSSYPKMTQDIIGKNE